jgi:hypothetical protein
MFIDTLWALGSYPVTGGREAATYSFGLEKDAPLIRIDAARHPGNIFIND